MLNLRKMISTNNIIASAFLLILTVYIILIINFHHVGYVGELTTSGGMLSDENKFLDVILVPLFALLQFPIFYFIIINNNYKTPGKLTILYSISAVLLFFLILNQRYSSATIIYTIVIVNLLNHRIWKERVAVASSWLILFSLALTIAVIHLTQWNRYWTFLFLYPLSAVYFSYNTHRAIMALGTIAIAVISIALLFSTPYFWVPSTHLMTPVNIAFVTVSALTASYAVKLGFNTASQLHREHFPAPPPFLIALALVVASTSWPTTLSLPTDDYHFGEALLAYQAFITNLGWYTEFLSPHSFSDALPGIFAHLLGNDGAPIIALAEFILLRILLLIVLWRVFARLGSVAGILVGLFIPHSPTELFTLFILMVILEAGTIRQPLLAGLCVAFFSVCGILLYGGPAVAAAVGGSAAAFLFHVIYNRNKSLAFVIGALLASAICLAVGWPQLSSQFRFLLTSASANLTIYGNGNLGVFRSYPQNLIFSITPTLAALLIALRHNGYEERRNQRLLVLAGAIIPTLFLTLLLNSYAMARIDDSGIRAGMATGIILVFLSLWLPVLTRSSQLNVSAGVVISSLLAMIIPPQLSTLSGPASTPSFTQTPPHPISISMPRLGAGIYDSTHLQRIRIISQIADSILEPNETFLNLTNRNSLYYYLGRDIPVPIPSTYNAAPLDFQKQYLNSLGDNPPPRAIIAADNLDHDGISLPLRSHLIYDYVLNNYTPFIYNGYVFGIRNDLSERLKYVPDDSGTLSLLPVTDENWQNGIAIGANANTWSFAVEKSLPPLKPGDVLIFMDGSKRRVVRAKGSKILVDLPLDPSALTSTEKLMFTVENRNSKKPSPEEIWDLAFHHSELAHIPSAWGRSLDRLKNELSPTTHRISITNLRDITPIFGQDSQYKLRGDNPEFTLSVQDALDSHDAGILFFTTFCSNSDVQPEFRVTWSGENQSLNIDASLHFIASYRDNLIALDTSPSWAFAQGVEQIKITVKNKSGCEILTVKDIKFFRRTSVAPQ